MQVSGITFASERRHSDETNEKVRSFQPSLITCCCCCTVAAVSVVSAHSSGSSTGGFTICPPCFHRTTWALDTINNVCLCSHINSHIQVRGHRTGCSHSGVEEYPRKTIKQTNSGTHMYTKQNMAECYCPPARTA